MGSRKSSERHITEQHSTGAARAGTPVTEASLLRLSNRALDELFRGSPSGSIPAGNLRGTMVAFPGTRLAKPLAVLAYLVAWQGKVVDSRRSSLKNKITPLRIRSIKALLSVEDSWVDHEPCVLIDYSRTSVVARTVRDEIRLVGPQLYLGVIWLRRRRIGWFTLREPSGAAKG
jgi:hypothetical protein